MTSTDKPSRSPYKLGPLPMNRSMITVDEQLVRAPVDVMFELAHKVENWPTHLAHYRSVGFRSRARDGGGLVQMEAVRPFGIFNWPTWWLSEMVIDDEAQTVRYRHVDGITKGMEVEWNFRKQSDGTLARIIHTWNGPGWPGIGVFAANVVIGPVFVHGIASRTLAGLARVAEQRAGEA
ncbi:MAG: SRPBCC family protein [Gemmatimonas sp.]